MKRVNGILVFTQQTVLDHKLEDGKCSENRYCYWTTKRFPTRFLKEPNSESRLYFAIKNQVKGYFVIERLLKDELQFCAETWVPIENGEILKPSQGWRYYLHD